MSLKDYNFELFWGKMIYLEQFPWEDDRGAFSFLQAYFFSFLKFQWYDHTIQHYHEFLLHNDHDFLKKMKLINLKVSTNSRHIISNVNSIAMNTFNKSTPYINKKGHLRGCSENIHLVPVADTRLAETLKPGLGGLTKPHKNVDILLRNLSLA